MSAPIIYPYLSWVPERNPFQKVHENLGQAKKAVLYRLNKERLTQDCRVYKWQDNTWILMWDIKAGTHREEMPWHLQPQTHSPQD